MAEKTKLNIDLKTSTKEQQTENICLLAIKDDPDQLRYAYYQTEKVCMAAVIKDPKQLLNIRTKVVEATKFWPVYEITDEVYKLVLGGDPLMLKYIPTNRQTLDLCITAFSCANDSDFKDLYRCITNPKVLKLARRKFGDGISTKL